MTSDTARIAAGGSFPTPEWSQTDSGRLAPAGMSGWRLRVVSRGAHCPVRGTA